MVPDDSSSSSAGCNDTPNQSFAPYLGVSAFPGGIVLSWAMGWAQRSSKIQPTKRIIEPLKFIIL